MAYAQWMSISLEVIGATLKVQNATHSWGKFYQCGDKDQEIDPSDIDKLTVEPNKTTEICACGRENASAGTTGSFDLYEGDVKVGTYSWDCPWGSKTNKSSWQPSSNDFIGQLTGGSLDSGALGSVTLKIAKMS
ncbi:MAG TPA: aegerolysin [Microscillaceae bacterium]|nr:aegerolysin [Microscillaceae bacterium]